MDGTIFNTNTEIENGYVCPGQTLSISRSLHLARLAAGYDACRSCARNCETGTLPRNLVKEIELQRHRPLEQVSVTGTDSGAEIRGIYLNEVHRTLVMNVVEHVLELWDESRQFADQSSQQEPQQTGPLWTVGSSPPRVLVGHDWRSSSPDLAVGVVAVLRRWGCEIIDVGQVNRPCFDFGIETCRADLGLFVTGGTHGERVNGLDIVDSRGISWSESGKMMELRNRLSKPVSRRQRKAGDYLSVALRARYATRMFNFFLDLVARGAFESGKEDQPSIELNATKNVTNGMAEPYFVRVALTCGESETMQILGSAILEIGGEVQFLNFNYSNPDRRKEIETFRYAVRDSHVDVGILIDSDGRSILVFDDRGRRLPLGSLMKILNPNQSPVALLESEAEEGTHLLGDFVRTAESVERLLEQVERQSVLFATDGKQFWFSDLTPSCDAIHVVARVVHHIINVQSPLSVPG